MYERSQVALLAGRILDAGDPTIQVVVGPRQTGKSTVLKQAAARLDLPVHSVSVDDALPPSPEWLSVEWQQARNLTAGGTRSAVLIVDEIQKSPQWSTVVKSLWDADRRTDTPLKVVLSGSSSLLIHKGLGDALTGRFELIHSPHWSLTECTDAFGYTLDDFLWLGGYPGASRYANDELRWKTYVRESIIEPTISQDVLALTTVLKPALLRALFYLGARYTAQELSYNKMLGQLHDAGNTTTLAHYLTLLEQVGILTGLPKFTGNTITQRASSPRLMVFDTSLTTAISDRTRAEYAADTTQMGHLVESAVGAYLLARGIERGFTVHWWRDGGHEVDFVLTQGDSISAVEVKSGRRTAGAGMQEFLKRYPSAKRIVVAGADAGSATLEAFLRGEVALFY